MCISTLSGPPAPRPASEIDNRTSSYTSARDGLAPGDEWLEDFDLEAFREDIAKLGKELEDQQVRLAENDAQEREFSYFTLHTK